jgi:hypothetical protein
MVNEKAIALLESYQLATPNADIKTMPGNLRKEVREYVARYLGTYSSQLGNIRRLKREEYVNKYKEPAKKELLKKLKPSIDKINTLWDELHECAQVVSSLHGQAISLNYYLTEVMGEKRRGREIVSTNVDNVFKSLEKEFDEKYGEGFVAFEKAIESFEKKVEEAMLFGVITDVYELIKNYDKLQVYVEKLSVLEVK